VSNMFNYLLSCATADKARVGHRTHGTLSVSRCDRHNIAFVLTPCSGFGGGQPPNAPAARSLRINVAAADIDAGGGGDERIISAPRCHERLTSVIGHADRASRLAIIAWA
jgi:hypothetical protein